MTQSELNNLIEILKSECRNISLEAILNPGTNTNPKELAIWGAYQLAERINMIGLNNVNQMELAILKGYHIKYA